eukprot:TRINITY_DN1806_c0_g4_i1.p1 TRINITY_DN1806_c0_g4~~TRINITY_DN1806_c0_g4_i1.p1  ORF type:complete len:163 (+),score=42.59 TRINITY_DN1806_c0_g4_i1:54-542(+)
MTETILACVGSMLAMSLTAAGSSYAVYKIASAQAQEEPRIKDSSEEHLLGAGGRMTTNSSRQLMPIVISSVLAIYGLIMAIIFASSIGNLSMERASIFPFAGAVVGFSGLFAGIGMGHYGAHAAKALAVNPAYFGRSLIVMVYFEALALYGMIVGIILVQSK